MDDSRFWDRFARRYAASKIKDEAGYERTLARTLALVGGMSSILEIGCGTGTTALRLAPSVGHILATDISGGMIAIAKEKAMVADCANVTFAVSSPETAAVDAGTLDAVLAFNVLHLLRDRAATLTHLHALLKPGGLLITKTVCLTEVNILIRMAIPVMRCIGLAPYVLSVSPETLDRDVTAAGFTVIERGRHGSTGRDIRAFLVAQKA